MDVHGHEVEEERQFVELEVLQLLREWVLHPFLAQGMGAASISGDRANPSGVGQKVEGHQSHQDVEKWWEE